ncbi:hypothetical protein VTI28DRAFT_8758 [Corynascus sepedonium]
MIRTQGARRSNNPSIPREDKRSHNTTPSRRGSYPAQADPAPPTNLNPSILKRSQRKRTGRDPSHPNLASHRSSVSLQEDIARPFRSLSMADGQILGMFVRPTTAFIRKNKPAHLSPATASGQSTMTTPESNTSEQSSFDRPLRDLSPSPSGSDTERPLRKPSMADSQMLHPAKAKQPYGCIPGSVQFGLDSAPLESSIQTKRHRHLDLSQVSQPREPRSRGRKKSADSPDMPLKTHIQNQNPGCRRDAGYFSSEVRTVRRRPASQPTVAQASAAAQPSLHIPSNEVLIEDIKRGVRRRSHQLPYDPKSHQADASTQTSPPPAEASKRRRYQSAFQWLKDRRVGEEDLTQAFEGRITSCEAGVEAGLSANAKPHSEAGAPRRPFPQAHPRGITHSTTKRAPSVKPPPSSTQGSSTLWPDPSQLQCTPGLGSSTVSFPPKPLQCAIALEESPTPQEDRNMRQRSILPASSSRYNGTPSSISKGPTADAAPMQPIDPTAGTKSPSDPCLASIAQARKQTLGQAPRSFSDPLPITQAPANLSKDSAHQPNLCTLPHSHTVETQMGSWFQETGVTLAAPRTDTQKSERSQEILNDSSVSSAAASSNKFLHAPRPKRDYTNTVRRLEWISSDDHSDGMRASEKAPTEHAPQPLKASGQQLLTPTKHQQFPADSEGSEAAQYAVANTVRIDYQTVEHSRCWRDSQDTGSSGAGNISESRQPTAQRKSALWPSPGPSCFFKPLFFPPMSPTTWENEYARRHKWRVRKRALTDQLLEKAPKTAPDTGIIQPSEKRSPSLNEHDEAEGTALSSERVLQKPARIQFGDFVNVDAEASPRQAGPDDVSFSMPISQNGSSTPEVETPGTQELRQTQETSHESHMSRSLEKDWENFQEFDVRDQIQRSASASVPPAEHEALQWKEEYFRMSNSKGNGDARFDKWVATKLRESQLSQSEHVEAEHHCSEPMQHTDQALSPESICETKTNGVTNPEISMEPVESEEVVHHTELQQPTKPDTSFMERAESLEPAQQAGREYPTEQSQFTKSTQFAEPKQYAELEQAELGVSMGKILKAGSEDNQESAHKPEVMIGDITVDSPAKAAEEYSPEQDEHPATSASEAASQVRTLHVCGQSDKSKSSINWADLSSDEDDPEIGFLEWKERNLPGYHTPTQPRTKAAMEPEMPKEVEQKPRTSMPSPLPAQPIRVNPLKKMTWSQVVRGGSTQSETPAQGQNGNAALTSQPAKNTLSWCRGQAQPQKSVDEEFPALSKLEKGKDVDRRSWNSSLISEQSSQPSGDVGGKQAELLNPFSALQPQVKQFSATGEASSPKEESEWERDWVSAQEGEGESSKKAAARKPELMKQTIDDVEREDMARVWESEEALGDKYPGTSSHGDSDTFEVAPVKEPELVQQEDEGRITQKIGALVHHTSKESRGKKGNKKKKKKKKKKFKHITAADITEPGPFTTTTQADFPTTPRSPIPLSIIPLDCSSTSTFDLDNSSIPTPGGDASPGTKSAIESVEPSLLPPLSGSRKPLPREPPSSKQLRGWRRRQRQRQRQRQHNVLEEQPLPSPSAAAVRVRLSKTSIDDIVGSGRPLAEHIRVGPKARLPLPSFEGADDGNNAGVAGPPAYRWTPPRYASYEELEKMIAQYGVVEEAVFDIELCERIDEESANGDNGGDDAHEDDGGGNWNGSDDGDGSDDGHGGNNSGKGNGKKAAGDGNKIPEGSLNLGEDCDGDKMASERKRLRFTSDNVDKTSEILLQIQEHVVKFTPTDLHMTFKEWTRTVDEAWSGSDMKGKADG